MSELTLNHSENGVMRRFDVWRCDGEVKLRLRERTENHISGEVETVVDNTVGYELADDNQTVAHSGDVWDTYAENRFRRLNSKRF